MLVNIAFVTNLPWIIVGDFNAYVYVQEKPRSNFHDFRSIKGFVDCLNQFALWDLGFFSNRFTWSQGVVKERLERVVGNTAWMMLFLDALVCILPPFSSDHCLTLISYNLYIFRHGGNRPFRFQATWFVHKEFFDTGK